jgi:hypothetical protein
LSDWDQLLGGANPTRSADIRGIKAALPLEWVAAREGIALEPDGSGRLVGLCPFHADESPSFAVFTQHGDELPLSRCGCWGCEFRNGDVFDFVERLRQVPTAQAVQYAAGLLDEFRAAGPWQSRVGDAAATRPKADPAVLIELARQAQVTARRYPVAIERLIDEKAVQRGEPGWAGITPQFLIERWGVGVEDDWEVVVPHLGRDSEGGAHCPAIKTRTARSPLISRSGSDLSVFLYGEFQAEGHERVLLVEGESDCWAASHALQGHPYDVLGLPSGSSAHPRERWLGLLAGRHVTIAFDGDRAGRVAARKWWARLRGLALLGQGPKSLLVATLLDGFDLSSVPDLLGTVMSAGPVPPKVGNVGRDPVAGVYKRTTTQGRGDNEEEVETVISNWSMEPLRELTITRDGTRAYEGMVNGRDVLLRSSDLHSESSAKSWSATVGGIWTGTSKDAQNLLGELQAEGPFLARGRACSVVGWHDRNFVLPDGYIGPDYWRYLPPPASIAEAMVDLRIRPGDWDPRALPLMRALNRPNVTDPIIAWLFASPLRSHFPVFPFLAVTGVSGNGKTAMMEAMLDSLGWKIMTTLTNSTPHGVQSFAGATNGIPVWFDEYRAAAREDSKTQLDQVLRDAYNGSPSFKGGGSGDNRLAMTAMPTDAPIIVTGEDAFQETSHFERMVLVKLDKRDRNPAAYRELRAAGNDGLGYAYLRWLVDSYNAGALPSLEVSLERGRVSANRQILGIGWELARSFHGLATGEELGQPDFSKYESDLLVELQTDPFVNAMVWALFEPAPFGQGPMVFLDGDDVMVRVEELVSQVRRRGVFALPGGARAFENYLETEWSGRAQLHPAHGRCWRLPGMAGRLHMSAAPQED